MFMFMWRCDQVLSEAADSASLQLGGWLSWQSISWLLSNLATLILFTLSIDLNYVIVSNYSYLQGFHNSFYQSFGHSSSDHPGQSSKMVRRHEGIIMDVIVGHIGQTLSFLFLGFCWNLWCQWNWWFQMVCFAIDAQCSRSSFLIKRVRRHEAALKILTMSKVQLKERRLVELSLANPHHLPPPHPPPQQPPGRLAIQELSTAWSQCRPRRPKNSRSGSRSGFGSGCTGGSQCLPLSNCPRWFRNLTSHSPSSSRARQIRALNMGLVKWFLSVFPRRSWLGPAWPGAQGSRSRWIPV